MSFTRPGRAVRCVKCGKTGAQVQGANNWKMCEKCLATYCIRCWPRTTACGDHNPYGKWLTANGSGGDMTFR
jgi:hypothetical protein